MSLGSQRSNLAFSYHLVMQEMFWRAGTLDALVLVWMDWCFRLARISLMAIPAGNER